MVVARMAPNRAGGSHSTEAGETTSFGAAQLVLCGGSVARMPGNADSDAGVVEGFWAGDAGEYSVRAPGQLSYAGGPSASPAAEDRSYAAGLPSEWAPASAERTPTQMTGARREVPIYSPGVY